MQNARVHCRGEKSIAAPPTIPVAHDLSDASKPRRKLRWQFDPQVRIRCAQFHGSQKTSNMTLIFYLLFRDFFRSRRFFVFPLSALRIQLDVIVDPRFVTCDDPFQEFIAFLWGFPVSATILPSQLLLRSEQFWYNLGANLFHVQMFRQNCVNGRLSQTKLLPLEVHGRPELASSLGSSRPSRKRWTHLKTVLSLEHTLHKPVATFDGFWGHSCPVSQETWC